jgi:hypothetical protein
MDDKSMSSPERHVTDIKQRVAAPAAEEIDRRRQSALRAAREAIRQVVAKVPIPRVSIPEGQWKESPQLCSERETITSMDKTLKQVVQILTVIKNHLTTSVAGGGNTDDGATSES